MDKRVLQERMRKKKRQMMIRRYTKLATYVIAAVLVVVFAVRGVILPIASRVGGGGKADGEITEVQAQTAEADPNAAVRRPLKGQGDVSKVATMTPGWHDSEEGRWYQNADGTYFAGGFQEIDGVAYSFDGNGFLQTGWVTRGVKDYYFNNDGSYNPEKKRPLLAFTFDDGPSQYTDMLLDCLEENNAHATFFMQGQNVGLHPETVKRMKDLGNEIGTHSWDHPNLFEWDLDYVAKQFADTDAALIEACGQPATVARAPYGNANQDIIDTVGKPFFTWSMDTMDWDLMDEQADYNAVMNGDLTDGSIILMHDIHEPSVKAALRLIPDLVAQGYKLVTLSEMAEAKNVVLQNTGYTDFWQSTINDGRAPGYQGDSEDLAGGSSDGDVSDGGDDGSDSVGDGSEDGEDISDGGDDSEEYVDDGDYSEA